MDLRLFGPALIAVVFGIVVALIEVVILPAQSPFPWRLVFSRAWVYACFCYIVLYGVIKAP